MDRRLVVRHDVDRDDRRRLSQGNRLSALREVPGWCVEPKKAQRSRCLPIPQPGRAVRAMEASCRPSGLNATACTP